MTERRGEPALRLRAVEETRGAVTQVPGTAAPPVGGALLHLLADGRAPVIKLDAVPAPTLPRLGGEHGDTGVLAAGIDTQLYPVDLAFGDGAVLQPDNERCVPVDDGTSLREQLPCPRWVGGLQRPVVLV